MQVNDAECPGRPLSGSKAPVMGDHGYSPSASLSFPRSVVRPDKPLAIPAPLAGVATPKLELEPWDYFVDDEGAARVGNNLIRSVDERVHPHVVPIPGIAEVDVDAAHRLAGPVNDGSPNKATGAQPHDHRPFLVALERERGEQLLAGFVEEQAPRLA